jgi:MGT family glycosyltransferase
VVADILAGRLVADGVIGEAWRALRLAIGLDDDPTGDRRWGTIGIYPAPRSLRDPTLPWPAQLVAVRPSILDDTADPDDAPTTSSDRTLVYATLGTVFNLESGDLLDRLAVALDRCGRDALLTVGPHVDVTRLAAVAPSVRIESFADHSEVFSAAAAIVFHGGSGTLVDAVTMGVPVVALPMGADQPDNADRCTELGIGIVLDPLAAPAEEIADAIDRVIDEPRFAAAAVAIADEARTQPRLADVRQLVECLTPS